LQKERNSSGGGPFGRAIQEEGRGKEGEQDRGQCLYQENVLELPRTTKGATTWVPSGEDVVKKRRTKHIFVVQKKGGDFGGVQENERKDKERKTLEKKSEGRRDS